MSSGKVRPPPTSVTRMTLNVRKITRWRCASGMPLATVTGIASAAASETLPRSPDQAAMSACFQSGSGCSYAAPIPGMNSWPSSHAKRVPMTARLTRNAYQSRVGQRVFP